MHSPGGYMVSHQARDYEGRASSYLPLSLIYTTVSGDGQASKLPRSRV